VQSQLKGNGTRDGSSLIFILGVKMSLKWNDATDRKEISLEEILKSPTNKYFIKRTSYGKIIKEDSHGFIVLTDMDQDGMCEITAVPKMWVTSIKTK